MKNAHGTGGTAAVPIVVEWNPWKSYLQSGHAQASQCPPSQELWLPLPLYLQWSQYP